jgi:hypothetical protein
MNIAYKRTRCSNSGQSLVEFVLVMPILVLILIGGFGFGLGTYDAHMASDAVQMPAMQKLSFADQAAAVPKDTLLSFMNGSKLKGSLKGTAPIDGVTIVNSGQYTSIIVGSKTFTPPASFVPGFTIRVGQVINRNLLEAANAGAEVRPYNTPWVPGGAPVPPPW